MKTSYVPIVLLVSLFFAACSTGPSHSGSSEAQLKRKWMLKKMDGFDTAELVKAQAYIDLTDLKNTTGKTGCNTLRFNTGVKAQDQIRFSGVSSTYMSCEEPFMKMEQKLGSLLEQINAFEIKAHSITFRNSSGKIVLEAIAADWD